MDKKAGYKKVVQILPILAYGDAIGNEVLAIDDLLQDKLNLIDRRNP